ncbi:CPBP family intramembrane glutamic endopeptidase [Paenibacillus harenae]|uniref:CAAX prenyl protease 2/Lysostaphin resistance protein A-like domain-containing protein n=1 Tax=Paenibacillus harenae TaxID=306543 RepID=A0ABT9U816_PAEHA|nr:type II CAAX endopeptidase family protein [Paenibacillus harenae]MDQ0115377.1 hypothetical protein [Paenibacillus harenae]
MIDSIQHKEWKRYIGAAVVCLIIYMFIDIVPLIKASESDEYGGKAISKAEAEQTASKFAEELVGREADSANAVHQSDKLMNGYISRDELTEAYADQYDKQFPTDTYQVEVDFDGAGGKGYVYVHMQNKRIVAWNLHGGEPVVDTDPKLNEQAIALLEEQGFRAEELTSGAAYPNGEWGVKPAGYTIGESQLQVTVAVSMIDGKPVMIKYKPNFIAPAEYRDYVEGQDRWAQFMTGFGFILMSFILFVLAVIYAVLYRRHTSFKRGIVLTIIYFVTYVIINLNVLDGIRASLGEQTDFSGQILITAVFTVLLSIPMAGSIYISLVAGDGLWKAQGRSLWPRFGQPGYGTYVWRSMGLGYCFAAILFALQAAIFIGLKYTIGTWSTSDVTQSPYNMAYLWLMPVLAWAAAISEEAVFRFFGIGLFRKWFKNTFVAALIPTISWALGHVMYPLYPSSTRLIELMIIGLIFSFIFVRYGLITAMFTHAIFNSVGVAITIFTVGSAFDIASGIFFVILPILIAYVIKYMGNKKEKNPPVTTVLPLERQ